jgi:hypothetical protein
MRFMIMIRAHAQSESGAPPEDKLIAAMTVFHEELAKAGVLLDANGLRPSSEGWRVRYSGGKGTIVDGPYAETKELIAGYTLIQVRSREEALEWTRRFPAPFGDATDCEIEVRRLYELDELDPSESVERYRQIDATLR